MCECSCVCDCMYEFKFCAAINLTSGFAWQPSLVFTFGTTYSRIYMTCFVRAITGTAYPKISIHKSRKAPCCEFIHTCNTCIYGLCLLGYILSLLLVKQLFVLLFEKLRKRDKVLPRPKGIVGVQITLR